MLLLVKFIDFDKEKLKVCICSLKRCASGKSFTFSRIGRATIDLEPKIRMAGENLILLPKVKQLFLFV